MNPKRFLSLPVLAVFLLMLFVYYTTIFVFIDYWVGLQSSPGTLNASIFTLLASLSFFSFFVCVLTDPGHVPSSYVPDVEATTHESAKDSAERKKCDKCFAYKPPRTHHCRVCRRCVLKMDHHCLWINNCVGYWNYKAFFVFASYATIASIHSMVLFISCVFQKDWESIKGRSSLKIFYVMYGTMVVALTITLSTLSGWHAYLILHNMTTIEFYEGKRAKWLAMKSGQSYRHPFNVGAYKNITLVSLYPFWSCLALHWMYVLITLLYILPNYMFVHLFLDQILGPNMLKWLCPTAVSHLKDGVSFPTTRDNS